MLIVSTIAVLGTMGLALTRALIGPGRYDRILAINMFGTNTVMLIALIGFLNGRPDFLDIALFYALVNFVGTVAVLRLTHYDELGVANRGDDLL